MENVLVPLGIIVAAFTAGVIYGIWFCGYRLECRTKEEMQKEDERLVEREDIARRRPGAPDPFHPYR